MDAATIREAGPDDVRRVQDALMALSGDLGDDHRAGEEALAAACFGPASFACAMLAEAGDAVVGVALASPLFSTTRGASGTYVSDLWVTPARRGAGTGRRLLAGAARRGAEMWGARFVKLAVYAENQRAAAFYRRLGFSFQDRERNAVLDGAQMRALIEETT